MTVVALTSARGAPGVTTSALALALNWPRPVVLIEADVTGSSSILAGYLQGALPHERGLVDLAVAHRAGRLFEGLRAAALDLTPDKKWLVPGLVSSAQAVNLRPVWEPLAAVVAGLEREGIDVIVDAGRLGMDNAPQPLLRHADVTLLVTRTNLPAVAATRAAGRLLATDLEQQGTGADGLRLLMVGDNQPHSAKEISASVGIGLGAVLAWDPVHAEAFSLGSTARRLDKSALVRSVAAAISAITSLAEHRRSRLAPGKLADPSGAGRG